MRKADQVDRIEAAEILGMYESMGARDRCLKGDLDMHPVVEAFARHRLNATPSRQDGLREALRIVRIRVTSMWESCNRTTFYVELTTNEGFSMTPCGHATGSDYTEGKGLSVVEARDRAVTDAGTWGDFLGIAPDPFFADGVEIKPTVPLMPYTTRRAFKERDVNAPLKDHIAAALSDTPPPDKASGQ